MLMSGIPPHMLFRKRGAALRFEKGRRRKIVLGMTELKILGKGEGLKEK